MSSTRRLLARTLAAAGVLGKWHGWRNRHALTVLSLHRVLPESDPRWPGADPLYTVSTRFFEQLLQWLPKHYAVVSLEQLLAARDRAAPLPACPLLITFDDGWADTSQFALPLLRKYRLPAVLFCAGEAIDRGEGFFQERMIAAWRAGRLSSDALQTLWVQCGVSAADTPAEPLAGPALRQLIARLQALGPERRRTVLEPLRPVLDDGLRHMISAAELRVLPSGGVALGTHGRQHEPLPQADDLDSELVESRRVVSEAAGLPESEVATMSFPFSRQNSRVVARARELGYRLQFGGGLSLTPIADGLPDLLARVGITAGYVQDARGNLDPASLGWYLFRRPITPLQVAV